MRSSLHRLAAGTILIAFDGTTAPTWLLRAVERDGYAGVIIFGSNIEADDQVAALTRHLSDVAPDLIVAVDEEGGDVTRLAHAHGSPYPGNAALGAVDDPDLTALVYEAMGADLRALGFNVDFAPSADVNTADDNPVIGTRSFGAEPGLVARHTVAAVRGLQAAGIAACVKHFPGHGATSMDSHFGVPIVDEPLGTLHQRELVPFRAAVDADVRAVMTAHVRFPALTGPRPATTSRAALHDLLRGEWGFDGLVVTDSMEMAAIRDTVGMAEGGVLAIAAGADLLCTGGELRGLEVVEPMATAIARAVGAGRLSEERLADAGRRVTSLARWSAARVIDGATDGEVGLGAARRAVTVLDGTPGLISRPFVIELQSPPGMAVGRVPWGLAASLSDVLPDTDVRRVGESQADASKLIAQADGRSLIVVTRDAHRYSWQHRLVDRLTALRDDVVVVEMGLPVWRPRRAAAYLVTYGAGRSNAVAATELLTSASR